MDHIKDLFITFRILRRKSVCTIEVELDQSGDVEYLVEDDYPAVVGFVMFLHIGLGIVSF